MKDRIERKAISLARSSSRMMMSGWEFSLDSSRRVKWPRKTRLAWWVRGLCLMVGLMCFISRWSIMVSEFLIDAEEVISSIIRSTDAQDQVGMSLT